MTEKKPKRKCSKCETSVEKGSLYLHFGKTYFFCKLCDIILSKFPPSAIIPFLEGDLKISDESDNMIQARIARAKGARKWT